jgi:hypothetical protein
MDELFRSPISRGIGPQGWVDTLPSFPLWAVQQHCWAALLQLRRRQMENVAE